MGIGCGLRRGEIGQLVIDHLQQGNGRWLIVDLMSKHRRIRTVPMPDWVKGFVDACLHGLGSDRAESFGPLTKRGRSVDLSLTPQAVYEVARTYGYRAGLRVAPHDLRRTFAKLSREGGASIEQIQHSLGHSSLTTTERYLGLEQDLRAHPEIGSVCKSSRSKPAAMWAKRSLFYHYLTCTDGGIDLRMISERVIGEHYP